MAKKDKDLEAFSKKGAEALDALREEFPDCKQFDVKLKQFGGDEYAVHIKANQGASS